MIIDTVEPPPCSIDQGRAWFSDDQSTRRMAAKVCRTCPLRVACLAEAIEYETPLVKAGWRTHGIWGGLTPTERARIIRGEA